MIKHLTFSLINHNKTDVIRIKVHTVKYLSIVIGRLMYTLKHLIERPNKLKLRTVGPATNIDSLQNKDKTPPPAPGESISTEMIIVAHKDSTHLGQECTHIKQQHYTLCSQLYTSINTKH